MSNRYVAFGYEITGGKIAVIESEKKIIENIFSMYINQKSFSEIAERMNFAGIPYNNDGRNWNKNMVKRIIENRKYLGEDGYPAIIAEETFKCANRLRVKKHTLPSDDDKKKNNMYHEKLKCSVCGEKLTKYKGRKVAGKTARYWKCKSPECSNGSVNENKIDKMLTDILNNIIESLEITCEQHDEVTEQSSDEIMITNEMFKMMSTPSAELTDIIDSIRSIAELRFGECVSQDYKAIENKILKELSIHSKLDKPDTSLIENIVRKIRLYPDKTIDIELINGYIAKGGHNHDTGCGISADRSED